MLAQVKSLQAQQAKLSSPAYIEQLARQELDMCFPGTQCYIVEGGQPLTSTALRRGRGPAPWYAKLWQSVQQADASPAEVITARDAAVIAAQLGRPPRGLLACRPPLPVRAARRRRDGAEAARRQPVPHALLPDLPAGGARRSASWRPPG